jgi:hypothetical protein
MAERRSRSETQHGGAGGVPLLLRAWFKPRLQHRGPGLTGAGCDRRLSLRERTSFRGAKGDYGRVPRVPPATEALVVRGSPGPAQVPDRRSPSLGMGSESKNAMKPGPTREHRRPSVGHSGGALRPAPNASKPTGVGDATDGTDGIRESTRGEEFCSPHAAIPRVPGGLPCVPARKGPGDRPAGLVSLRTRTPRRAFISSASSSLYSDGTLLLRIR